MQAVDASALAVADSYESNLVPYVTAPCAEILLENAKPLPGERVVDVAAGTGIVARLASSRVGASGRVVAVDVNPAMLEVGRARVTPGGATIEWMEGDAQDLPLSDGEFDLALCQHGLQYIPDGTTAMREMRRVLRPGGRVGLMVWSAIEHNPFAQSIWTTIARHLQAAPETLTIPFACGDPAEVRQMLDEAGFQSVSIVPCSLVIRLPRPPNYIAGLIESSRKLMPVLDAMGDDQRAAIARSVEDELAPVLAKYSENGHLVYPASLQVAMAWAR